MRQDVQTLSPTLCAILEALGRYMYLTAEQMERIGVSRSKRHIYDVLRQQRLHKRGLIKGHEFGASPETGRLPFVYHLTPRGVEVLEDMRPAPAHIRWPKRARLSLRDFLHMAGCIDIQIAMEQIPVGLQWFKAYYDQKVQMGSGFSVVTTIQDSAIKFTPDAIAMMEGKTPDRPRLMCLELHRGRDTGRLMHQVEVYASAIQNGLIERSCAYEGGARILFILENSKILPVFMKRMTALAQPDYIRERFYVSTLDNVRGDFLANWSHVSSLEPVGLFD